MNKFLLIFLFSIRLLNSLKAQSFNDEDAINIFKTYQPRFGFEGIYQIYTRSVMNGFFLNKKISEEITDQEFKTLNDKVCIYTTNEGVNLKIINFTNNLKAYDFYKTNLVEAQLKVDIYNRLIYHRYQESKEISTEITIKGETLFWDFNWTVDASKEGTFFNYRVQFLLKKLYSPTIQPKIINKNGTSYGTGFLFNSAGYILTNNHVVNGASKIYIQLSDGKKVECSLISSNEENDIAIIKPKNNASYFSGSFPLKLNLRNAEVGSEVFTLGYPLVDKMGTEIKATSGIISSNSGYQGDKTTYQISAPIQPGNSGGPLFNSKGEVIGMTNAKLKGAENASYAIKASILSNFIISDGISVNNTSDKTNISTLPLPQKIKHLKNSIFIIICE